VTSGEGLSKVLTGSTTPLVHPGATTPSNASKKQTFMNSRYFNSLRRAALGDRPDTPIKTAFWTICLAGLMALPTLATERTWTGAASGFWSNPGNWSPSGKPQNGDDLEFLGNDSNDTTTNDLSGLVVTSLTFSEDNYWITGNSLSITSFINNAPFAFSRNEKGSVLEK